MTPVESVVILGAHSLGTLHPWLAWCIASLLSAEFPIIWHALSCRGKSQNAKNKSEWMLSFLFRCRKDPQALFWLHRHLGLKQHCVSHALSLSYARSYRQCMHATCMTWPISSRSSFSSSRLGREYYDSLLDFPRLHWRQVNEGSEADPRWQWVICQPCPRSK